MSCNTSRVLRKSKIQQSTAAEISSIINYLASDELQGRDTGSEGFKKAADFIEKEFKKNNIQPYFETYKDSFKVGETETFNVVGYLKGTDPVLANEFVILGAHLDHIGLIKEEDGDSIANGANDNAAGSAAVLVLARQLSQYKSNKRSVLFMLFGAEEKGLLGSEHLAKVLKQKNLDVYTMINFEMIGVPLRNKSYSAYITGYNMSNMAAKINEYADSKLVGFLPKAKTFGLFKRSDNYPFYNEFHVPAQTICTFDFTNYEYYHHVNDEASELDFEFMAGLINNCFPVIEKITNTETKEIQLN